MCNETETSTFRKRLTHLRTSVKMLREKGIITGGSYYDYMLLIWRAKTFDQLDEVARDLTEIRTLLLQPPCLPSGSGWSDLSHVQDRGQVTNRQGPLFH
jgi:hypothetical protein